MLLVSKRPRAADYEGTAHSEKYGNERRVYNAWTSLDYNDHSSQSQLFMPRRIRFLLNYRSYHASAVTSCDVTT